MKAVSKKMKSCGIALLLSMTIFSLTPVWAADWTWESLVSAYDRSEEDREAAGELRRSLLADVPVGMDEEILWKAIWSEVDPRKRAILSLGLVERIFPEGKPGRWEEVRGFWRPAEIPRSLAALDAVFVAALSLLEMNDDGAPALALNLVRDLSRSPRARYHALLYAPREYETIIRGVGKTTRPLPFDRLVGTLPLARSVRGWISQDSALDRGATFLDGQGGVARGSGPYAWDREKGKLYRVRDGKDRFPWLIRD